MVEHKFELVTKANASALICTHCKRPFIDIQDGKARLVSKHGSKEHENFLTVEHLRMLIIEMWRQSHPPFERW